MKNRLHFSFPGSWLTLLCVLTISSLNVGAQNSPSTQSVSPRRVIAADYSKVKGKHNEFFRQVVGAGRAAEGLRAEWQRDLGVVQRECGFKYIRFHGLLQDEMGVYSEDKQGKPIYNFQYVDALDDAILKLGLKPFVEFGFMPPALASGSKTIFWWKGNITPPKDYGQWERLIQALVQHWTARYGADEVKQWYFEVWNEPNLDIFWSGDQAAYFKLYEVTARAIKSVSPDYRVGGPATAAHDWISETIKFAAKNRVPLDFISTHDYGVKGIGFDGDGVQQLFLDPEPDAIIGRRAQRARSNQIFVHAPRCRFTTPSGARLIRPVIRFTILTYRLPTFSQNSKARKAPPIRCLTGHSRIFSRRTAPCRRPFMAASGCSIFKGCANHRFTRINF